MRSKIVSLGHPPFPVQNHEGPMHLGGLKPKLGGHSLHGDTSVLARWDTALLYDVLPDDVQHTLSGELTNGDTSPTATLPLLRPRPSSEESPESAEGA